MVTLHRVWIEILDRFALVTIDYVTLHAEGVD